MSHPNSLDPILKGRTADPSIREGIMLVEYPEYLIADALDGDGLQEVHRRMGGGVGLTPESAASTITEMIVERLADDIEEDSSDRPSPERSRPSFIPHISAKFPQPVISRIFGKKPAPEDEQDEPVFADNATPIHFESSIAPALLMRAEAVSRLWRQGKIEAERAAHLLESAVMDYRANRKQK